MPRAQRRSRTLAVLATALLVVAGLTACTNAKADDNPFGSSASNYTPPPALPGATISSLPANGAANVKPTETVSVRAQEGWLLALSLKGDDGSVITGKKSKDETSWVSTGTLAYGRTYTIRAQTQNREGLKQMVTSSFKTVVPDNFTMPYLNTTGGFSLRNGATYGIGIVPVAHFDEPITDKAAAERSLKVTTTPKVIGSWYWDGDQDAHYRPKNYWASGTKVTVEANVFGVEVGDGLWGQANAKVSFTIGAAHRMTVDGNELQVRAYNGDELLRTMPTSMGQGGWYTVKNVTVHYWTQPGTYTVIGQGNPVLMDSSSYGIPVTDKKNGYKTKVYWSTRISNDGIYLHSAPWSVWAQGSSNQSHGCLNLSPENAEWVYNWVSIGDPIEITNTGGPALQVWQNGDWSVPWSEWVKGSAIKSAPKPQPTTQKVDRPWQTTPTASATSTR